MKTAFQFVLPAIAAMALMSCTTITPETSTSAKIKHGVPGGQVVQTQKITATVTGIDAAKREVTFVSRDGKKFKVKAGPEVVNFHQIRIGDQLNITLTEKIVIRLAKKGEKTKDGSATLIGLAPVGDKPGAVVADAHQVTAVVTAIDLKKHQATLQFADGSSTTVNVRQDVDLTKHNVGQKVVIQTTEVYAIMVEKP